MTKDYKMKITQTFVYLILTVLLASCANVSKAPEEQSSGAKDFQTLDDRGSVYLYRTGRAVGAAGQLMVKVNGNDAGGTGPGTFFKWDLSPGLYTFMSSARESSVTVQLEVKAGENYFIRQDARLGIRDFRVTMKEVDQSMGMK